MSIRLRKAQIAAAIEDVAQPKSAQEGAYQGPRVLDDAPVQAVLDLSAYRPPVQPTILSESFTLSVGDRLFFDLTRGGNSGSPFARPDVEQRFSFARFVRVATFNSGGGSGNYDVQTRVLFNFDPPSAPDNQRIGFTNLAAGTPQIFQYGYDIQDQSAANRELVLPSGLVIPPDVRLVLDVDNTTDADVEVLIFSWAYQFDQTDILI